MEKTNEKKNELVEQVIISVERYEALIMTGLALSSQLADAVGDNEELGMENASLNDKISKLEAELEEMTKKSNENHDLWAWSNKKNNQLEEELKALKEKYEQLCKEYDVKADELEKVKANG